MSAMSRRTMLVFGDGSIGFAGTDVRSHALSAMEDLDRGDPPKNSGPQALRAWTNITRSNGTRQSTGEDKTRNAENSAKFVSEDKCPDRWWTG